MLSFYLSILETNEDKDRFEKLYRMFKQDMYAIAYSILNNKEDAEDAVHQAFVTIADNFEKVNIIPRQEIKAYIVIIIRNISIDIYRGNKRIAERTTTIDDKISVDIDMLEQYDYQLLLKSISELPEIYKDVMFLRYLEEFTPKEIADMLNITVSTVWKRLERAKKMLKENLERDDTYAKQ